MCRSCDCATVPGTAGPAPGSVQGAVCWQLACCWDSVGDGGQGGTDAAGHTTMGCHVKQRMPVSVHKLSTSCWSLAWRVKDTMEGGSVPVSLLELKRSVDRPAEQPWVGGSKQTVLRPLHPHVPRGAS